MTDKGAGKNHTSAFLVPTNAPCDVVARLQDKIGQHRSGTAQIGFEGCRVLAASLRCY